MNIEKTDVEHVALLSRLEVSEEEKEKYAKELSAIFDYVEELSAVNVEGVEPSPHPLRMMDVLRDDTPRPSLSNDDAVANAPESEAGCFKVPQII